MMHMLLCAWRAEFRRLWVQYRRYPTESLSQMVIIIVIFYGLFLGASYMAGGIGIGDRLNEVIVGYVTWVLVVDAVSGMGFSITNESQNGTLEQVFLSPLGAPLVLLVRYFADLVFMLLFTFIVMIALMALTNHWLRVTPGDLLPAVLAIVAALGIGYLVSSVAILFKRANQLLALLQFVLLFIVMTPLAAMRGVWHVVGLVIPLAPTVGLLRFMMIRHVPLFGTGQLLLWSVVNGLLWFGIGFATFRWACAKARRRGVIGHY